MVSRKIRDRGKRALRSVFELGQQIGVDVLPRHFYSEIPNIDLLRDTTDWRAPLSMSCIEGGIASQLLFVDRSTEDCRHNLIRRKLLDKALELNGTEEGYGVVEADYLYCFLRKHRPQKIVQVGCGVSTAVCLMAAMDESYDPEIICIEPYPTAFLKKTADQGKIRLVEKKLQQVYGSCPSWLSTDDLFFVDSSHTLGPSGEASRIILEILPRLQRGTFVHFHDIWFPYDYSPTVLTGDMFFWHETALLYAFLCMNKQFTVAASLSMLHHMAPLDLQRCLPTFIPAQFSDGLKIGEGDYPSAIYLRS